MRGRESSPQEWDRDSSWFGPPPAAAKADRFSVTRENEEGTRLPYLQDVSEVSDAALCRANGCSVAHVPKEEGTRSPYLQDVSEVSDAALCRANGCGNAVLSNWSRTLMVQDRMAQGFGITQEARKEKYALLGTADNFNSLLSSGLSSSRLSTAGELCWVLGAEGRRVWVPLGQRPTCSLVLECNSAVGASAIIE